MDCIVELMSLFGTCVCWTIGDFKFVKKYSSERYGELDRFPRVFCEIVRIVWDVIFGCDKLFLVTSIGVFVGGRGSDSICGAEFIESKK